MSIRPITFNPDGSIDVVYDETGHSGTIAAADIKWTTSMDGSDNHNYIVLNCPDGCGGSSTHPVGGGAAPPDVQQLFVNKMERDGCGCGQVEARADGVPFSHARLLCNRLDGPGRWQIDTPVMLARAAATAETANQFEVIYRISDRMILGMLAGDNVGSDCAVQPLDQTEYEVLMRTDPAYLSQDGLHVIAAPELVRAA